MFELVDKDARAWLDEVDKVNENPWYNRANVEKYIGSQMPGMFFWPIEVNGKPAALAVMASLPSCEKKCWLVAQLCSFKKGYGEKLLRRIDSQLDNVWLSVNIEGGEKLAAWYASVLPQLGWKKIQHKNRWHEGDQRIWTFWLKAKDPEAEAAILDDINGR